MLAQAETLICEVKLGLGNSPSGAGRRHIEWAQLEQAQDTVRRVRQALDGPNKTPY